MLRGSPVLLSPGTWSGIKGTAGGQAAVGGQRTTRKSSNGDRRRERERSEREETKAVTLNFFFLSLFSLFSLSRVRSALQHRAHGDTALPRPRPVPAPASPGALGRIARWTGTRRCGPECRASPRAALGLCGSQWSAARRAQGGGRGAGGEMKGREGGERGDREREEVEREREVRQSAQQAKCRLGKFNEKATAAE